MTGVGGGGLDGGGGLFFLFFRLALLLLALDIAGIVIEWQTTNGKLTTYYLRAIRLTSSKMTCPTPPVGPAADLANWVQAYWKLQHSGRSLWDETDWTQIEECICYDMVSEGYATVTRPRLYFPPGVLEVDNFVFTKLFTLTTTSPTALLKLWYLCQ